MYNFVVFGITNDFYRHSFADLKSMPNVIIREDIFESRCKAVYYLYRLHTFPRISLEFPFTSVWDSVSYRNEFKDSQNLCFIFMPKHANRTSYFSLLRRTYPGCKLVMTFRDRVDRNLDCFPNLTIESLRDNFDLIYSYNKYDCQKYGFLYFNTEATKEDISPGDERDWSDVVFVGSAKDRYERIIEAYKIFQNAGLKTDFYIVGAPRKSRFNAPGITFADRNMSYSEMLERTINSRCILEISQSGEWGFTSRSQEAIMYNKRLITDSLIVKEQKYYPSKNIYFFNNISEIDPLFPLENGEVDYGYEGDYSPKKFIEQIEAELNRHT